MMTQLRRERNVVSAMWHQACFVMTVAALVVCTPACGGQPAGGDEARPAGTGVGPAILSGYRRYSGTCSHCHGPDGVGSSFAPSLIEQLPPFARFEQVVRDGSTSGASAMRGFADDPNVAPYARDIYLYLQARAAGAIGRGRPALRP